MNPSHLTHVTIIWLSPNGVFALTPPAPAGPVLPNLNHVHVHICCSEWSGGHSFEFYFHISPQNNGKSLVNSPASLCGHAILPVPVLATSGCDRSSPPHWRGAGKESSACKQLHVLNDHGGLLADVSPPSHCVCHNECNQHSHQAPPLGSTVI